MKGSNQGQRLFAVILCTMLAGITSAAGWAQNNDDDEMVVAISDARMKFEINSTDLDGGIQIFIDAEPWQWMKIYDPTGELIFKTNTGGSIGKTGGTELFMESAEPDFSTLTIEELLARFPAGDYRFRGKGMNGEKLIGTATLTHDLPDGPKLVYPLVEDTAQDPNNTTVMWEPVGPVNGSPIIAYEVLVVQLESGFPALPKVGIDIFMPASATSMVVPAGFLLPDTEYEWEVLAIEASGNQTLSSSYFHTAP